MTPATPLANHFFADHDSFQPSPLYLPGKQDRYFTIITRREGAVKYTDYAIGKFMKDASVKPWFKNTIFVIVADHCASASGSVQLPVTGYHIPMLIYSPGNIQPKIIDKLTAQIDIAPTLLGLLHFNYNSQFFGQDIFDTPKEKERIFISTYQGLGYLRNNELIVQTPVKKIAQYTPDFITGKSISSRLNDTLAKQAMAYYQTASWLINHKAFHPINKGKKILPLSLAKSLTKIYNDGLKLGGVLFLDACS